MALQESKKRIGIYAGTFDPITKGHINIIQRSLNIVDFLYIAVAENSPKNSLFSVAERINLITAELEDNNIPNNKIKLEKFSGLLVNFAKNNGASILIRGVRTTFDFEYEHQMASVNSLLNGDLQTIFLPAEKELQLVSSKFAKEVVKLGGDASYFLSKKVKASLIKKYRQENNEQ